MSMIQGRIKQFAVLGLGRFGMSVVQTLSENGFDVLACDMSGELVQDASEYAVHCVQVDVTDESALETLGLGNFDVVFVAVGHDFEACLIATMFAKEKGVPIVIAKANDLRQKKILEGIGADKVVLPEKEMGERIAHQLIETNVIDYISLSPDYQITEMLPQPEWVGKVLSQIRSRGEEGVNIIAIKRGGEMIVAPGALEVFQKEDILVAISATKHAKKMR